MWSPCTFFSHSLHSSEGAWVKVVGYLRSFHGTRNLVAFRIHRVEDMNEIAFHQAHAAYVHLYYEKGQAAQMAAQAAPVPAAAGVVVGGDLQQRVLEFIKSRAGVAVHVNELRSAFQDSAPDDVLNMVKHLADEGWIFTAGDDDHYTVGHGANQGF